MDSLKVSCVIPARPDRVYKAWLSSKEHSAFTGGKARVGAKAGGKFTAWDGYISGITVELEPNKRIVQKWRTADFPDSAPDSLLEILVEKSSAGTKLTVKQSMIPRGQGKNYKKGWGDYYFTPMKEYFASLKENRK